MDANDPRSRKTGAPLPGRSHPLASRDPALLARPELRPVRLMLEYLGPELRLADHGVRHTIVVFGSTRLADPDFAARALEQAERDAARDPGSEEAREAVRAAQRVAERSRYYEIARELGRIVGRARGGPPDNRLVVMTGGGPGGMEAANRGAHDVGAASAGLNIALPHEQDPNPFVTPELCFQFRYFALRKLHLLMRARSLVALPGGFGTFDELFETLCLIQTGKHPALPVILVGESFWRRAVDFDFLVDEGMIEATDLDLFSFAETAEQTWRAIVRWYEDRNLSVFDDEPGPEVSPG